MTVEVLTWEELKDKRTKHSLDQCEVIKQGPAATLVPLIVDDESRARLGVDDCNYNNRYPAVPPGNALVVWTNNGRRRPYNNRMFVWTNFPLKQSMIIKVCKLQRSGVVLMCMASEDPMTIIHGEMRRSEYYNIFQQISWTDTPVEVVVPVAQRLLGPLLKILRRRKPYKLDECPVYVYHKEERPHEQRPNPNHSEAQSNRRQALRDMDIYQWTPGVWVYYSYAWTKRDNVLVSRSGRGSIQLEELERLSDGTWEPGGKYTQTSGREAPVRPKTEGLTMQGLIELAHDLQRQQLELQEAIP